MTPEETTKNKELTDLLRRPFPAKDVQFMPMQMGDKNGKPWMKVLAYLDSRALENFLDVTFGVMGWSDDYTVYPQGIICKLSVLYDGVWVSKSNGAPETDIEAFKGGCSSARKRVCSSGFGIGRYLYYLPKAMFAECSYEKVQGWEYAKDKKINKAIYWNPVVKMPAWAYPQPEKAVV